MSGVTIMKPVLIVCVESLQVPATSMLSQVGTSLEAPGLLDALAQHSEHGRRASNEIA